MGVKKFRGFKFFGVTHFVGAKIGIFVGLFIFRIHYILGVKEKDRGQNNIELYRTTTLRWEGGGKEKEGLFVGSLL